jgi:tetratricopeptide (TPR) repeat protein
LANPLNKAVELLMAGRLEEARRACRKVLQARADLAEAHMLLGEIDRQQGDEERARPSLERVLRLRPGWTQANIELALADLYSDFGRLPDAEAGYRRALERNAALSDARYNLAALLGQTGRGDESARELEALLQHEPQARDAREQLVRLEQDARRHDRVEALCRAGAELHPQDAFFAQKLGVARWWLGRHDAALEAYRHAAALAAPSSPAHAESMFLLASGLLTLGRLREGWETYRFRPSRLAALTRHPEIAPVPAAIDGSPKRIRLYSEQGLGDELFFLRFAPALRARGHRIDLVCEPKLAALIAPLGLFEPLESADLALCTGDLPVASGEERAPPLALTPDAACVAALRERLSAFGPPPYVGVTWRAGLMPEEQKAGTRAWSKEVAPARLGEALRPLHARVVVLQRKPAESEVGALLEGLGRKALDLSAVNDDLRQALAALSLLDEYVGVSNTNMHLLAGIPAPRPRVLVQTPAEWRWGLSEPKSAWFPGFRLYRQVRSGDWEAPVSALRNDLLGTPGVATQHK